MMISKDIQKYTVGVSLDCPRWLLEELKVVDVIYLDFNEVKKQGKLVVHQSIAKDIIEIFNDLFEINFPIYMMKPLSNPSFWEGTKWSDKISMSFNNTSAFNFRTIAGKTKLSTHALGMAIDINPLQNPYIKGNITEPAFAQYQANRKGTFYHGSQAVKIFQNRGFFWGGNFKNIKDYHHFERKTSGYEKYFID